MKKNLPVVKSFVKDLEWRNFSLLEYFHSYFLLQQLWLSWYCAFMKVIRTHLKILQTPLKTVEIVQIVLEIQLESLKMGQKLLKIWQLFCRNVPKTIEAILNNITNIINKIHTVLISVLRGFQKCITWNPSN